MEKIQYTTHTHVSSCMYKYKNRSLALPPGRWFRRITRPREMIEKSQATPIDGPLDRYYPGPWSAACGFRGLHGTRYSKREHAGRALIPCRDSRIYSRIIAHAIVDQIGTYVPGSSDCLAVCTLATILAHWHITDHRCLLVCPCVACGLWPPLALVLRCSCSPRGRWNTCTTVPGRVQPPS